MIVFKTRTPVGRPKERLESARQIDEPVEHEEEHGEERGENVNVAQ